MIFIPEVILFNLIKGLLTYIEEDFNQNGEEKSILYKLLYGNKITNFDFYEEGKKLFLRSKDDSRKIDVRLFFSAERASMPTIHLTLPSEEKGSMDGIGFDQGYSPDEIDQIKGNVIPFYTRSFSTTYNLVITSNNTWEVILMYSVLKSLLIGAVDSIELDGLRNPRLGGGDLQLNSDLIPPEVFIRTITLSVEQEQSVPRIFNDKLIKNINIILKPVEEI